MKTNDFNQIIEEIKDKMYRLALRIVLDPYEAEDVVQEIVIKAWEKREYMATVENPQGWLMTLTRNKAIDKTRSKHKRTTDIDQFFNISDTGANPEHTLLQKDLLDKVKAIINALPEHQRTVLHLRDIEEYAYDEISDITGQTPNQVKINIYRARQAIKEQIEALKKL